MSVGSRRYPSRRPFAVGRWHLPFLHRSWYLLSRLFFRRVVPIRVPPVPAFPL